MLKDLFHRLLRQLGREKTDTISEEELRGMRDFIQRYKRRMKNLEEMKPDDMTSREALNAGFQFANRTSAEAANQFAESLFIVEQAAERKKAGEPEPTDPAARAKEDEAFQFLAMMVVSARAER